MKEKSFWRKYAAWLAFGVILIVIFKTIDNYKELFSWVGNLISLLMPFFLAGLLAFILYPSCSKLEGLYKKIKLKPIAKKARAISVVTVYVILIVLIVFLVKIIFPALSESVIDLASNLPSYYTSAKEFITSRPDDSWWAKLNIVSLIEKLEEVNLTEILLNWLDIDNISKYIEGITSAAGIIFDIFVTFVVSVYVLLERSDIKSFFKNFLKAMCTESGYKKIVRYYKETNSIFYRFISAQILDAIIVGIITSVAMTIMNVKYAVLLGFIIGLFNIIPYFGAIVGVGIAIIITIFTGGWAKALWLALVIIILQQIDANIINPKILGNSLQISRILIIFSITFFGAYFGVLGMFLGVPIIALIKVYILDVINERLKEKNKEKNISTLSK